MPGIKPDRRMSPRRGLQVPVVFHREDKSLWSVTEDISAGGLRFIANMVLPIGSILELKIYLDPQRTIDCLAKVCP